jgi:hypothetical protein
MGNWKTGTTAHERGHIESIAAASYQATKLLGAAYSSATCLGEASSDNGDSNIAIHLGVKDHAKDYVGFGVHCLANYLGSLITLKQGETWATSNIE